MKKLELGIILLLMVSSQLFAAQMSHTKNSMSQAAATTSTSNSTTTQATPQTATTSTTDYQSMSNFTAATEDVTPVAQSSINTKPAAPAKGMVTSDHPVYALQLNSNPSTGYSWFLVSYPSDLLTISQHTYVPPSTDRVGAGGYEVWEFTAKPEAFIAPRVMKIQMMYARPWEINDQSTKQTFYLVSK